MNKTLVTFLAFFLGLAAVAQDKPTELNLVDLEGDWTGNGQVVIPITRIKTEISGDATFSFDEENNWLHTAIKGTKFFFTYSDSGHLTIDPITDSVTWEVWDNYGKHALYHGMRKDNRIFGSRQKGKDIYSVSIDLITSDSLTFKLVQTKPDSSQIDRASFDLWRVKEDTLQNN